MNQGKRKDQNDYSSAVSVICIGALLVVFLFFIAIEVLKA